jgi:hypothetical protein
VPLTCSRWLRFVVCARRPNVFGRRRVAKKPSVVIARCVFGNLTATRPDRSRV